MTPDTPRKRVSEFPQSWRRSRNAVVGAGILQWLGFSITGPFIPLYVQELIGTSDVSQVALWSGLSVAISPLIASTVMVPIWGTLADRIGTRSLAILTLLNAAGLALLAATVRNPQILFLQRVGVGFLVTYGLLVAPMASLSSPREHLVSTMGRLQTSRLGSGAIGPALGGILVDLLGMRLVYVITTGMFLGGAFWIWIRYYPRYERNHSAPPSAAPIRYLALIRNPVILLLAALIAGAQFVPASLLLITPLYINKLTGNIGSVGTMAGLIISSGTLAMALTSLASGQIRAPRWRALVIVGSLSIGVVGCLALVLVSTLIGFAVAYVMIGAASGMVIPLSLGLGGLRSPANIQGRFFFKLFGCWTGFF